MALERLQKVLARAGVASRRAAERLIVNGRVNVDGRPVTELGVKVDPRAQRVEVDGRRVEPEPFVYVVLHKPRGVVSTMSDPEGRPTVAELVRSPSRVVPVGRLDFHTSGVLLLTNDGEFQKTLLHPSKRVEKVYVAKVAGVLSDNAIERFSRPIVIGGRKTSPADVKRMRVEGDKTWLQIRLREGRNRQVRRMGEAAGIPVLRLARVEFAGITAEGLRPGQYRYLTREELADMKKTFGVPKKIVSPPADEGRKVARGTVRRGAGTSGNAKARKPKRSGADKERAGASKSGDARKPSSPKPRAGAGRKRTSSAAARSQPKQERTRDAVSPRTAGSGSQRRAGGTRAGATSPPRKSRKR